MVWITVKSRYGRNRETLVRVEDISCIRTDGSDKEPYSIIQLHSDQSINTPESKEQIKEKIDIAEKEERAQKLAEQQMLIAAFAEALAEKLKEPRRYTAHDKKSPHDNRPKTGKRP